MSDVQPDDVEHDEVPDDTPEQITVAREMFNWKPRDEFEGDPKRWRSAADMAKHAKQLVKESRTKHGEASRERQRSNELAAQFRQLEARLNNSDATEVEARMDAAFERGDNAAYQAAKKELQQLRNARSMSAEPVDPAPFADFKEQNADWFQVRRSGSGFTPLGEHKEAVAYAISLGPLLAQEYGGDTPELYAEIKKRTERRFPEIKGEAAPVRNAPRQPQVGPGGSGGRERIAGKITATSLNAAQKDAAKKFGKTNEQWAAILQSTADKENA